MSAAPKKASPQKRIAPTVAPVETGKQSSEGTSLVAPSYPNGDGPGSRADAIRKTREKDRLERERIADAKRWAMFRPTTSDQRARLTTILKANRSSDTDTQERRMAEALQGGRITSHEARQYLDIVHPAGRIKRLRDHGYVIDTGWVTQLSAAGQRHRFGVYSLIHLPVEGV